MPLYAKPVSMCAVFGKGTASPKLCTRKERNKELVMVRYSMIHFNAQVGQLTPTHTYVESVLTFWAAGKN